MVLDHLDDETKEALALTPAERILYVKADHWMPYEAAKQALKELADLISHPRNLRMPCRALIGDADNGKSTILQRCSELHCKPGAGEENPACPVIRFDMPSEPDEGRFYSSILESLGIEHRPDAPPEKLRPKVIDGLIELEVKLMLCDEFHNMLQGSVPNQRQLLASVKSLLNAISISFVAAGTEDVTRALAADSQFTTRFEKIHLPRWRLDLNARRLLKTIERKLPFPEPSTLDGPTLAPLLVGNSGNTIGGIVGLANKAAIWAIEKNMPHITKEAVEAAVTLLQARTLKA